MGTEMFNITFHSKLVKLAEHSMKNQSYAPIRSWKCIRVYFWATHTYTHTFVQKICGDFRIFRDFLLKFVFLKRHNKQKNDGK